MNCRFSVLIIFVMLASGDALAETTTNPLTTSAANAAPTSMDQTATNTWSFAASLSTYLVPDDDDYVQPTFSADHDWLHVEARYNYEAIDTSSAWLGYNFGGGEKFTWEFTPMLGGVFGVTKGIAPGYKASFGWRRLELYSEGEYLFDSEDSSGSFFYNWSELTFAPTDWIRLGMVTQRTRIYHEDRDITRGPLLGLSYKQVDLTGYVLDPDSGHATFVIAAAVNF